jgi:hypothetical protein
VFPKKENVPSTYPQATMTMTVDNHEAKKVMSASAVALYGLGKKAKLTIYIVI